MTAKRGFRALSALVLVGLCAAIWTSVAAAEPITIGALGEPTQSCFVSPYNDGIFMMTNYLIPLPGTIIEWRFQTGTEVPNPESQLKVMRAEGGNFKVVGEADLGSTGAKEVVGRSVDIPVQIGDILGYYSRPGPGQCLVSQAGWPQEPIIEEDLLVGESAPPTTTETSKRLPVAVKELFQPIIKEVSPQEVHVDSERTVTIHGDEFEDVQQVKFGNQPAISFTRINDDEIKAVTPSRGEGRVHVHVITPAGETEDSFDDELSFGYEPHIGATDGGGTSTPISTLTPGPGPTQLSTPATCTVPQLKGKTMKAAKAAIRKADCEVGTIVVKASAGAAKAKVATQHPAAAERVSAGTRVNFKLG